jgi:two-component system sensor histidine kinase/response regulator
MLEPDFLNARILIVDDEEANIDILTGFLETQGFSAIKSTVHPRTVITLFKSFSPDIMLLDLLMPHVNGFEILGQIKAQLVPDDFLPILVLTADSTIEAKQRAMSLGARDFLLKPFDLHEVGLRIRNLLYTRYLNQQLKYTSMLLNNLNPRPHEDTTQEG